MKTIITHSGVFHADDAMACAIIQRLCLAQIVRTRDPRVLETKGGEDTFIVDVGGEYDPTRRLFDHHQRGGAGARPNGIPYAAAGLVWKAYGPRLVGADVATTIDKLVMASIDAVDTGTSSKPEGFTFSAAISALNPAGNATPAEFDDAFRAAVYMAGRVLDGVMAGAIWRAASAEKVRGALHTQPGKVLVLDEFLPWQDTVVQEDANRLLVVFPAEDGSWRVQVVPASLSGFESRIKLPSAWGGLPAAELQKVTRVSDATFCHPGLFIAGARTKVGALLLADVALAAPALEYLREGNGLSE